jgi:predicted alpha/beta hydrolase family esterase
MPTDPNLNLVLLHGYAESPNKVWFPWMHRQAEELGWRVYAPELPSPLRPTLPKWLKTVMPATKRWDRNTIIVGHSLGGVLALRALAKSKAKVKAVVLVASPFASTVPVKELIDAFNEPIDWAALKKQAGEFVAVHAKNDPLVPYDHALRYQENLAAKLVLTKSQHHFTGKQAKPVWEQVLRLARR